MTKKLLLPASITILTWTIGGALYALSKARNWPLVAPVNLGKDQLNALTSVYLGVSATGAIFAGFAGIIIVFGLTPTSDLFRRFRRQSGDDMVADWLSMIWSAFGGTAMTVAAALINTLGQYRGGSALFVIGVAMLVHSAARSVHVLWRLLDAVKADDIDALSGADGDPIGD